MQTGTADGYKCVQSSLCVALLHVSCRPPESDKTNLSDKLGVRDWSIPGVYMVACLTVHQTATRCSSITRHTVRTCQDTVPSSLLSAAVCYTSLTQWHTSHYITLNACIMEVCGQHAAQHLDGQHARIKLHPELYVISHVQPEFASHANRRFCVAKGHGQLCETNSKTCTHIPHKSLHSKSHVTALHQSSVLVLQWLKYLAWMWSSTSPAQLRLACSLPCKSLVWGP